VTLGESLLWPLTLPYGAAVRLRARAYRAGVLRAKRLDGTVISVGNLTMGWTGKTPMVLWTAERLLADGKKVGILTRGYRGETSAAGSTSDEVQLMQERLGKRAAFGVGADRFARGQELAKRGVDWFVLDDGFQHLQLARDVNIVLIDAANPFGRGHLLPAGRLREPRSALARADIIVITRSGRTPAVEAAIRRESDAPVFYARTQLDSIRIFCGGNPAVEAEDAHRHKFFAFCGIGNPSAFLEDLRDWGLPVAGHKFFRDHHRYTPQDARAIEDSAREAGADALVCTEKDIFNLVDVRIESLETFYCRISMHVDSGDDFWCAILSLAESRASSHR